ncbi:MAG: YCII-related domain protein [Ramlibacter sp.]|jgi:uncharacterized protein YciI|uniref:YciI family protein n=1 Tax=Ramlibacter sp. TaxID=1917967 RepID=UPI002626D877|nr:YciI family protein [Ramlibacter sp.]MDB5750035.1 YCII-related domain protein [Ramlibacter sp.]
MNTYALIYTMRDVDRNAEHRPAHIEFLRALLRQGRIQTGWKFPQYEAGAIQGVLICQGESAAEVAGWFERDPVITSGARTFEVREALPMAVQA